LAGCGRCDTCTALEGESDDTDALEVATVVRKALSAVARVHRRFGLQAAVRLLAGLPDPRLERSGLQATKTFGTLKGRRDEWLTALLRRCVTAGWVDFTTGDRPLIVLTAAGKSVLFADGPVRLLLPPEARAAHRAPSSRSAPRRPPERASATPEDT